MKAAAALDPLDGGVGAIAGGPQGPRAQTLRTRPPGRDQGVVGAALRAGVEYGDACSRPPEPTSGTSFSMIGIGAAAVSTLPAGSRPYHALWAPQSADALGRS